MATKDKVSITLPVEIVDAVRVQAKREHRSVSGQIAYFLSLSVELPAEKENEVPA